MNPIYREPDPQKVIRSEPTGQRAVISGPEKTGRGVHLGLVLFILLLLAMIALKAYGCGGTLPPIQCPPVCLTPLPTFFPKPATVTPTSVPMATPTPARSPSPAHSATATATRVPQPSPSATRSVTPTASPTPTAGAPTPFRTTGGRAVIRLDLASFRVAPDLDYYAASTMTWDPPGSLKPDTPALELSLRGTSDEHCLASPCSNTALGLVARWSSNIRHDAGEPDEKRHCGEGVNYKNRLPIGPGPTTRVVVEWGPDLRRVTVSTDWGSWVAKRGVDHPGFGFFFAGIANAPKGIGWAREPWSLQTHGGTATLESWESVGPLMTISQCG